MYRAVLEPNDEKSIAFDANDLPPVNRNRTIHIVEVKSKYAVVEALQFAGDTIAVFYDDYVFLLFSKRGVRQNNSEAKYK
jgi:hypothetical protein